MEKLTITVEELAQMLNISRPFAYSLVNSENGPPVLCIGRRKIIPIDSFRRWMAEQSEKRIEL